MVVDWILYCLHILEIFQHEKTRTLHENTKNLEYASDRDRDSVCLNRRKCQPAEYTHANWRNIYTRANRNNYPRQISRPAHVLVGSTPVLVDPRLATNRLSRGKLRKWETEDCGVTSWDFAHFHSSPTLLACHCLNFPTPLLVPSYKLQLRPTCEVLQL